MRDPTTFQFPFTLRDMLSFEHGLVFSLRVRSQAASGEAITIRGMTREGVFTFQHTPNADKTTKEEDFRIPDLPILVSITNTGGTRFLGQCYATLSLVLNGDIVYELAGGYINTAKGISYPKTNLQEPGPPGGSFVTIVGTNPAAGVEVSEAVPLNIIRRIRMMQVELVTDATVANRRVHLVLDTGQGAGFDFFSSIDQTASQTIKYTFAPIGAGLDEADDNDIIVPIPDDLIIMAGGILKTVTTNLQAGDNFVIPYMYVEEFFPLRT